MTESDVDLSRHPGDRRSDGPEPKISTAGCLAGSIGVSVLVLLVSTAIVGYSVARGMGSGAGPEDGLAVPGQIRVNGELVGSDDFDGDLPRSFDGDLDIFPGPEGRFGYVARRDGVPTGVWVTPMGPSWLGTELEDWEVLWSLGYDLDVRDFAWRGDVFSAVVEEPAADDNPVLYAFGDGQPDAAPVTEGSRVRGQWNQVHGVRVPVPATWNSNGSSSWADPDSSSEMRVYADDTVGSVPLDDVTAAGMGTTYRRYRGGEEGVIVFELFVAVDDLDSQVTPHELLLDAFFVPEGPGLAEG